MKLKIIIVFVVIFILILTARSIYIFFKVDSCLDHGFVWDSIKNKCIDENLTIEGIKCYSEHGSWIKDKKQCIWQ